VTIYSGTNFVQWSSLPNSLFSSDWATHQITLDTTSFVPGSVGADFNLIMSNVTSIQIRGELISFAEREGLDNVMVTAAATPAPSTLVMSSILFGMFGVVWSYKRFKQTAVAA
jgi:hypothetical protein